MSNTDKKSASQRIEDLETGLIRTYNTIDLIVRDLGTLKDAIKLLGNKVDSVVTALNRKGTELTDDMIAKIMVENNAEELKQKLNNLLLQGVLAKQEVVAENSFLAGCELDKDGVVVNPRLQFALKAMSEDLQTKLMGAKIGDIIELQEGKLKFQLLEVYSIENPKAEEPKEEESA